MKKMLECLYSNCFIQICEIMSSVTSHTKKEILKKKKKVPSMFGKYKKLPEFKRKEIDRFD